MSKTINVNASEFEKEVLRSSIPVLVDFWAEWCGPCRMMAPVLDQISEEQAGKLKVVKVDVEDALNVALAQSYDIRSIPNMKLFRDGKVVREFIGLRPKETLLREIGELS
ncbi:MAG: thioredoxin [Candidatus Liptonbacteria bacterium RIFCSPHIGHO2_01_FULL_57_28]|uniref:Thioredoxin n=1 Tax=Candidatus Liptonbacteria bacterium RIFCSPHIGHO2_01_FULL_57_28 TaxID=1798647 RepID=A0A1G2C9Y0_9BACT|nr:MAG: thioredoxin [Candidatus Liptonbacteria bacterium RIFCSPHIGHO2_01_FULL_57_28]